MKFDDIIGNRMLWAVKYDGDEVNVLNSLFESWNDVECTDLDGFIDFQNYS